MTNAHHPTSLPHPRRGFSKRGSGARFLRTQGASLGGREPHTTQRFPMLQV